MVPTTNTGRRPPQPGGMPPPGSLPRVPPGPPRGGPPGYGHGYPGQPGQHFQPNMGPGMPHQPMGGAPMGNMYPPPPGLQSPPGGSSQPPPASRNSSLSSTGPYGLPPGAHPSGQMGYGPPPAQMGYNRWAGPHHGGPSGAAQSALPGAASRASSTSISSDSGGMRLQHPSYRSSSYGTANGTTGGPHAQNSGQRQQQVPSQRSSSISGAMQAAPNHPSPANGHSISSGHHHSNQSSSNDNNSSANNTDGVGSTSVQQQYMPNRLNGEWQSNKDMEKRREMIQHIVRLLKQKDKNASQEWLNKLPQMVKQLEVSLYRSAPSFEAYADISTLKHRLQLLAMEIAKKTQKGGSTPPGGHGSTTGGPSPSNSASSLLPSQQQRGRAGMMSGVTSSAPSRQGNQVININEINPMMRGADSGGSSQQQPYGSSTSSSLQHQSPRSSSHGPQHQRPSNSSGSSRRRQQQPMSDAEREAIVRTKHKQQRLLLLHHASKCPHEDGRCPVTNHCADMKRLWKHMARCTDTNCQVSHCFSSRSILSHYRKCTDSNCKACGPVREMVRRSGPNAVNPSLSGRTSTPTSSHGGAYYSQSSSSSQPQGMLGSMRQPTSTPSQQQHSSSTVQRSASSDQYQSLRAPSTNHEPTSKSRLRHKQQRLLLLRHASKCSYKDGQCPVTPLCGGMKRLWKHISDCKDQKCKVQHCMSSRYVLSHYRRCKDTRCPACEPVREVIRRQAKAEVSNKAGAAQYEAVLLNNALGEMPGLPPAGSSPYGAPSSSDSIHQPPNKRARTQERVGANRAIVPAGGTGMAAAAAVVSSSTSIRSTTPGEKAPESRKATKVEDVSSFSLINSFTVEQIEAHLASLNRTVQLPPAKLKATCLDLLKALIQHEHGWVFNSPVDPVELGLPDYPDIIKKPMDLGTIQKKLDRGDNGQYHSLDDFCGDVHLTFDNAILYNEEGSVVHNMAQELKDMFTTLQTKLLADLKKEEEDRRKNERACSLCGCEKLLFEPPVHFCNGMNCTSKRIRRNSHYYVGGGGQYFWCNQCYNDLDGNIPIEVGDLTMEKGELMKKKNDEVHEESWVQCDTCERWIHQICGLFNARQNKEHKSEYNCPSCLLKKRKQETRPPTQSSNNLPGAENLPRTKLSQRLESHVRSKLDGKIQSLIKEKVERDGISHEVAREALKLGGQITIRQVTSTDRKLEVRERMKKRYSHKNYPDEFPFRCKCIVVFQNLGGVDVILFALYVYEHGENNPAPNKRTVYISYLDSVHFMKPRRIRTFVYHEILISYLDYVRMKGFVTAHIWACPPLKGDDYIFYAKPEDQRTPKDTRLKMWYIDMLVECQRRSICGKVTNMYDEYFSNKKLDAADVPYLEGDYFPGEAENIIKDLEDGKGKGKGKKGAKSKKKIGEGECKERDEVMVKLGEIIKPMKESFIVAYLNCKNATDEAKEVPKEIREYRENHKDEQADASVLIGGPVNKTKKRDANGIGRSVGDESNSSTALDENGEPVKVIDDDDEELDCEFLNNRQAFLNLCRGNHYQFDELRRSKHTSMMVLWHLHNRGAPKFVQQCASCSREILSGVRYHCSTCPDFDLCSDCFKNPKTNRGACTHKLEPIAVEGDGNQDGNRGLTEQQRRERQRNIQLHIALIEHASRCNSPSCTSQNCVKMKTYLKHSQSCKIKASGGCKICKRIWTLLRIHSQSCKLRNCPMPQCNAIRERIRQLAKQQQAMDDRRRMAMNGYYQQNR